MLWKGRWLAGHIVIVLVATAFLALGFWQVSRNNEKHEKDDAARAAYAAPAPELDAGTPPGDRAEVTGEYVPDSDVLWRNRVRDGDGGYDVLTVLERDDGTLVVVDRGWVPRETVMSGDEITAPTGVVTVRGPVSESRPFELDDEIEDRDGYATVPRVDLDAIAQQTGAEVSDLWITAQFQDPAPNSSDPELPVPPPSDDVNHLQYAFQWFAFAAIALIGWPIVLYYRARPKNNAGADPAPTRSE